MTNIFVIAKEKQSVMSKTCPKCQNENPSSANYCLECGDSFVDNANNELTESTPPTPTPIIDPKSQSPQPQASVDNEKREMDTQIKVRRALIILSVLGLLAAILSVVSLCNQWAGGLLSGVFVVIYCAVKIIRVLWGKKYKFDKMSDLIAIFLAVLGIIISFALTIKTPPAFIFQLNYAFFPKDSINHEEIGLSQTDGNKPLRMIFAFDNSGEGLSKPIDEKLRDQYEEYRSDILSFCHERLTDSQRLVIQDGEKITYRDWLKIRLCHDLIRLHKNYLDHKGEVSYVVMKIGDPNIQYSESDEFSKFKNEENMQKEIVKLLFQFKNDPEPYTNFTVFFSCLKNLIDENSGKYAIHIYSDFYHDIVGEDPVDEIIERKQDLLHNKVANFFIDKHPENRSGVSILGSDSEKLSDESYFDIDSMPQDDMIPSQVIQTDKVYWFYPKSDKEKINTSYKIIMPRGKEEEEESVRIISEIDGFYFNDSGKQIRLSDKLKTFHGEALSLGYDGKEEDIDGRHPVDFEVVHDNIHYIIPTVLIPRWNIGSILAILIAVVLLGIVLPMGSFNETKDAVSTKKN